MSSRTKANRSRLRRRGTLLAAACIVGSWAALRFAAATAVIPLVQTLTGLVVLTYCVLAAVDRGERQAFAGGFAIWALAYWLVQSTGAPYFGDAFGTDAITQRLNAQIAVEHWVDKRTGQVFDYDPSTRPAGEAPGAATGADANARATGKVTKTNWTSRALNAAIVVRNVDAERVRKAIASALAAPNYERVLTPSYDDLAAVARCLWTLVLGFCGGSFGRFVYVRRVANAIGAA